MSEHELDIPATLQDCAEQVKRDSFADGYAATDAEAMGIALARWSKWDGLELLRTLQYALEDANFHTESAAAEAMADKIENDG